MTDEEVFFVLKPATDPRARLALRVYAIAANTDGDTELADEIWALLEELEND